MFEKILAALKSLFKGQPSTMEVATELDNRARESGERLDWRNSIVDLLKTLKLDSSMSARAKLAEDCGLASYTGTAAQNIQLHGQVMARITAHGFKL